MNELPKYPPINPTVAKSIAKPDAFAKPGVPAKTGKGVRVRAMKATKGRTRKLKRDPRYVEFF